MTKINTYSVKLGSYKEFKFNIFCNSEQVITKNKWVLNKELQIM